MPMPCVVKEKEEKWTKKEGTFEVEGKGITSGVKMAGEEAAVAAVVGVLGHL